MKKGELRRQTIIEKLADYILVNGIQTASLRNLAEAAETSDRMLLHYFKDKEELLTVVLTFISDNLMKILEQADMEQKSFYSLVQYLYKMIKDPQVRPYLRLWLELTAVATKKEEPFYSLARQMCDSFFDFYYQVVQVDGEEEKEQMAALVLVTVEGLVLLDTLDYDSRIMKAIEGINKI